MGATTARKPWTEEQKKAARDAYQQRQREKGEEPSEIDIDELLAELDRLKELAVKRGDLIDEIEEELNNEREKSDDLRAKLARGPNTMEYEGAGPDYPMVDRFPMTENDKYDKSGHIFSYGSTVPESGEWIWIETHDFHNQSSYSNNMVAWASGMVKRAMSDSRIDPKNLPEFNEKNKLEIRVRIVPG